MTSPPAPVLRRSLPRPTATWALLLACAAAYALAVVVGRATRLEGGQLALVQPAAAVGFLWLTAAWSRGRLGTHVAALVVVNLLVNAATGAPPLLSLGFAAANVVQAVTTAGLLRVQQAAPGRLRSAADLRALALACTVGAVSSAVGGALVMWSLEDAGLLSTVLAWTMRNCSSAVVLGALALRLADRSPAGPGRRRTAGPVEAGACLVLVTAGWTLAFGQTGGPPLEFVLLPLSMWVALRGRTTVAAAYVVLAGLVVVVLTAAGRGPFAPEDVAERVLLAQAFVTVVALVVLTLALSADDRVGLVARLREERRRSTAQAAMLETVLDTVDVAIVACDADGHLTLANRTARELQLDRDPATGGPVQGLFHADGVTVLRADELPLAQVLSVGALADPMLTVAPPGRPARTVHCVGRALRDGAGELLGAVVVSTDVTVLRASEQQFRAAFEDGPTPMVRLDGTGAVEQVNAAMRRFLALPTRQLVGTELATLALEDDRARVRAAVAACHGHEPVEVRLQRADGTSVWCEITPTVVRSPDGQSYVLVHVLDVHARKTHELALEDVAQRDALTGVDNRHVLDRRLTELLHARDSSVVLAYLDLDGFKEVNDRYGHEAGDAVLRATGARLLALVRAGDIAVRRGGDEFVLACPVPSGAVAAQFAARLTERLESALGQPVEHAGTVLTVGVSVGTALAAPGSDPAAVLHEADLAMYAHKRARKLRAARPPQGQPAAKPAREHVRPQASGALERPATPALDDLTRAAALVAGVPTALVTLVDDGATWSPAGRATAVDPTPRDLSSCDLSFRARVVADDAELHVEDARRDPRFADDPLVTGEPALRSYAGFPLRTADGSVLGTLGVLGDTPALLDERQREVLRLLAGRVVAELSRTAPEAGPVRVPAQRDERARRAVGVGG